MLYYDAYPTALLEEVCSFRHGLLGGACNVLSRWPNVVFIATPVRPSSKDCPVKWFLQPTWPSLLSLAGCVYLQSHVGRQ